MWSIPRILSSNERQNGRIMERWNGEMVEKMEYSETRKIWNILKGGI